MSRTASATILPLLLACFVSFAHAAGTYPIQTIQIVVGFTPGGGSDTVARVLAPALSAELKVPVIVENKPGAGGAIATDYVAKAKPDGYTLLLASPGAFTIAASLRKLPYDPIRDFTPIAQLDSYPNILVANAQSGISSMSELILKAKEHPGKLDFASTGSGTTPHLAFVYLNMLTGMNINHVPYKGNPPAISDLLGGQVSLLIGDPPALLPHIAAGKLKALAVTTKNRSKLFPDIPSMSEAGVQGYDVPFWHAMMGPRGLSPEIVEKLEMTLKKVLARKDVAATMAAAGMEVEWQGPVQLIRLMADERARWGHVIKENNITE